MSEWTAAANEKWQQYAQETRKRLEGTGAEPEEVLQDIRSHVETELQNKNLSIVTEEDISQILLRIGYPEASSEEGGGCVRVVGSRVNLGGPLFTNRWGREVVS